MVKHQRRIHWCGLRQQQVVGGYKSDLSVSEVPPILTQTNMPWPGPTAVVIDQALSRGGQSIYRAAWSGIDPTQRLYQYHMQNASECAIQKQPCVIRHAQSMEITQEPFCIGKQGNVGVAPLGSSMSQFFQGPRALGALSESHSSVEDILYTQNMAAPMSSSPGPSIVSHTSSDRRNTLCTRVGQDSNTYVMHSIATVDQQPTVQLNQWIEQTQTGESYIYSTAAERMQWCHEQAALELARLGRLAG
ncbi:hypothetical protein NQ176_g356 [Zarea fungicola]|uniref:Uncharacterized protein n=1 Tax=Zarea fungicola TaxID=93591 RepID=A0ACC1NXV0_9HYPO|nr:hypothetical protein NQ176_g356 [Lecanicillium fungicola]